VAESRPLVSRRIEASCQPSYCSELLPAAEVSELTLRETQSFQGELNCDRTVRVPPEPFSPLVRRDGVGGYKL
jgi:hypothetical protein